MSEDDGDEEGDEDEVAVLVRYGTTYPLKIHAGVDDGGQPQVGQAVPRPLSALPSIPTTPPAPAVRGSGGPAMQDEEKKKMPSNSSYLSTHTAPARHDCHAAAGA